MGEHRFVQLRQDRGTLIVGRRHIHPCSQEEGLRNVNGSHVRAMSEP